MSMVLKKASLLASALFVSILVIHAPSFGQNHTLHGTILTLNTQNTGSVIPFVKVDVDSGAFITQTDANGNYVLNDIPAGTHHVRFTKKDFKGFYENIDLQDNKTFNVSMPSTVQTVPLGTDSIRVNQLLELYNYNTFNDNPQFWQTYPLRVALTGADSADSLMFKQALGAGTANWQDSPNGSVERMMERKLYVFTDSLDATKVGGYVVIANGQGNLSQHIVYAVPNGFYRKARSLIQDISFVDDLTIATYQHEVAGWGLGKRIVESFTSNMNNNMVISTWSVIDNVLSVVVDNYRSALLRGDADNRILRMIDYVAPQELAAPILNDLVDVVNFYPVATWSKVFTSDKYQLELATNAEFTEGVELLDVDRVSKKLDSILPLNNYFVRVRAINDVDTSAWSNVQEFATATIVPVELTYFKASRINENIKFDWETKTETNNYGFTIEKTPLNPPVNGGRKEEWNKIGFVEGKGTTTNTTNYSTILKDQDGGKYRLKQIDLDGNTSYSQELKIDEFINQFELVQNYPNPFNNSTNITYKSAAEGKGTLSIYNLLGQRVEEKIIELKSGTNTYHYTSTLSSGIYIYRINSSQSKMMTIMK